MTLLERQMYAGGWSGDPLAKAGGTRLVGGPEAVKAMDSKRRIEDARDLWPYPWSYPPPASDRRNPTGYIVAPAIADGVSLVFTYRVPSLSQFELTHVMFAAVTTGMVPIGNPGDYLFTIARNVPAGSTSPQGSAIADFYLVPFCFGNPQRQPIKLARSENFQANDTVSLFVTNISGPVGSPSFIVGMFAGWERKA